MKTFRFLRFFGILLSFIAMSPGRLAGAVLTGAYLAGPTFSEFWDTRSQGGIYNLWFSRGIPGGNPDGLTTPIINGPDNDRAGISILLRPGTNHFTIHGESVRPFYNSENLNLYLDGANLPSMSVSAGFRRDTNIPPFVINCDTNGTFAADGTFPVPTACTNVYDNGAERVVLTEFFWAHPDVYQNNRVGGFSATGEGNVDCIGHITLVVYPRIETPEIRVSQVEISWFPATNALYQVLYRSTLTTNIWTPLGAPVLGSGEKLSVFDPVATIEPRRFYQILRLK